jgi:predicted lipid-binding transport protein (Tim44 family)
MKLATILTCAFALIIGGWLVLPQDAEAKRFGGGRSLGRQMPTMPRQAQPPKQTTAPSRAQAQPTPGAQPRPQSGMSRWLGPLAGLAAGGLLASLFFGDGFEGISFMDMVIIFLLIIGAVWLFRTLRGGRSAARTPATAAPATGPAGAAPAPAPSAAPDIQQRTTQPAANARSAGFTPPDMGSAPPSPQGNDQFPFWLDGIAFIEGAKTHFIRLQESWDKADFDAIREYTTPELFDALRREREQLAGDQSTEVVQLKAEMVTMQRDRGMVVASIRFHGLIREQTQGVAESFSETWHVVHDWDSPDGDWLIAGIQQD